MQTIVEIPRTEEQLRRIWGVDFKPTERETVHPIGRETVQVVINIPSTAYQGILNANNAGGNWNDDLLGVLCRGVANGTLLPKGHGELKDTDVLRDYFWDNRSKLYTHKDLRIVIDNAPTIIEADKESEDNNGKD